MDSRRAPGRVLAALAVIACAPTAAADWLPCTASGLTPPGTVDRPAPPYPESARLAGVEGHADVAFTILRDGRVGWLSILRAEPSGFFEDTTRSGVLDWRFEPARLNGAAVECRVQTRVRFTLTDGVPARITGDAAAAGPEPPPRYPDEARIAGLQGYVEVEFDVLADGRVADAVVTLAMPRGEFERAALEAVRRWRLAPDRPGRQRRRFDFTLPESLPEPSTTLIAAAPLPKEACTQRLSGRVVLEVDTDADGRVTAARVLSADPPGVFDATALAMARASRLTPARRGDEPIAAKALLTLRFDSGSTLCPGNGPTDTRPPGRAAPTPRVSASGVAAPGLR